MRNYFENLVQALENGLSDVDGHGACSRAGSSKNLGGKGRGGRGKGTSSKSGGPVKTWMTQDVGRVNTVPLPIQYPLLYVRCAVSIVRHSLVATTCKEATPVGYVNLEPAAQPHCY